MTSNQFARVKELLLKVADLSEDKRQAFLDDAGPLSEAARSVLAFACN
jgi:hypothetical protein